jgi:UDP:flavonoid glycosyltransferase YjiC (YdhE family)
VRSGAIRVVPADAQALAEAVLELLGDPAAAEALGLRGQSFAEQQMGVPRTVRTLDELLAQLSQRRG